MSFPVFINQGCMGVADGGVEFVGSVVETDSAGNMNFTHGISIQDGDLMIIAFADGDDGDDSWSWSGDVTFTALEDYSDRSPAPSYVGYAFLDGTETQIQTSLGGFDEKVIICAVFRNAGTPTSENNGLDVASPPDPPEVVGLTSGEDVVVIVGAGEGPDAEQSLPGGSDYTLIETEITGTGINDASAIMAYKLADSATENPAAFTEDNSRSRGFTVVIPPA